MTDSTPERARSTRGHVQKARAGREEAWDKLVDKIRQEVAKVVQKYPLPRDAEIDDVVQVVSTEAFRRLETLEFRVDDSFRKWVWTIAKNWVCGEGRKEGTERRNLGHRLVDEGEIRRVLDEMPGSSRRPLSLISAEEMEKRIRAILDEMSPRHQRILKLREEDELSYAEIVEEFGFEQEVQARSLVSRAREVRRELIRKYFEGDDLVG